MGVWGGGHAPGTIFKLASKCFNLFRGTHWRKKLQVAGVELPTSPLVCTLVNISAD